MTTAEHMRKLYRERRQQGLCVRCEALSSRRAHCDDCREDRRQENLARYDDHRARGLCVRCTRPALVGHVLCEPHVLASRRDAKTWRERRGRIASSAEVSSMQQGCLVARRYRVQSKTPHPYDTPAEMSPVGRFYCGTCNADVLHRLQVFEPTDGQVTALHRVHSHRVCLGCGTSKCSATTTTCQHRGASAPAPGAAA